MVSRVNKDETNSSGNAVEEASLLIDRFVREPLILELSIFYKKKRGSYRLNDTIDNWID
jgi:hypothetical protein